MNGFKEYVRNQLSEEQMMVQVIKEFEQYEVEGFIGDCLLRDTAHGWLERTGNNDSFIIITMNDVATVCYRFFAEKYLAQCVQGETNV